MRTSNHLFTTPELRLEVGESIAAAVSYETYGQLSPLRNNAILLCQPFLSSSRVHEWWEPLVGPGRAFDTNRYFVVTVENLCSPSVRDPAVSTTGPSSQAPETGRPYGSAFPQVTVRDNVRLQRQLLEELGVSELVCVAGPSTGGFTALEWAVTYPKMVQQVIAVASAPAVPPLFAMAVCQATIDAIQADPEQGVVRAMELYLTLSRSNDWLSAIWGRRTAASSPHPWAAREGRYAFQAELEAEARAMAARFDPLHLLYTARMAILHDIAHGNRDQDVAVQKISAELLLISVASDILFPSAVNEEFAALVRTYGGRAVALEMDSTTGHQAALLEAHRLAEPIMGFLGHPVLH